MSWKDFLFPVTELVFVVLIYFLLRRYTPVFTGKIKEIFSVHEERIISLRESIIKLLDISVFVLLFNILLDFPVIGEFLRNYILPILHSNIIDTEAIKLSFYSILKGFITFYILLLITRIIRKIIEIYITYRAKGEDVASTVDILVYHFALVLIFLITLSTMGITWKLLIPIAGALGIGIGFGIQDVVNNFISGFIILISKTVKRGDWITLGDNFGKVVDIGIRTSTLRTLDNIDIIIPNSQLVSNQLINWSYVDPVVRVHIPVGVSYRSDVNLVKETLLEIALDTPFVLESPSPEARFIEFGSSSLNFELLVWINVKKIPIPLAKSELNYRIWSAFKEKGIEIPFPQRDVWFKNELVIKKSE
ncbi:MAG TPA: mechanosensitive ion channel protein MscS [Persephonella sp.]|uniref:MscS Mechanosensitive ion channel n=1 Tax=Persephonella marina (strain DSM 14350 / EX-H1) TaxID=123214 RepID=C0QPJ8_PERMH|nr:MULTISPECIES: mechanosensitive ion channel domain-containing protein [Persephonella]ACO03298.1 MscS Mechanosensitive ion channel [Persephonella marina EX-H1]HCB69791.1 mechanosensitive ion channel protein MscS [Persephonella sp.]